MFGSRAHLRPSTSRGLAGSRAAQGAHSVAHLDKGGKQNVVLLHQFGHVHIAEHLHEDLGLSLWPKGPRIVTRPQRGPAGAQDREHVAQAEVVVCLLGQLLLTQLVQPVELPAQSEGRGRGLCQGDGCG